MAGSYVVPQLQDDEEEQTEENLEATQHKESPSVFRYQVVLTITLVGAWTTTGLRSSMDGTCFPDQRDRLGATTQQMSSIFAATSIVGLISGLVFGTCLDMWKKYAVLFMSIALLVCAVLLVVMRFLVSYVAYFALSLITNGFLFIPMDLIGNAVILRTWGKRATGPMYAIHFGFGLGGAIGPFLAKPFLSPDEEMTNCSLPDPCPTTEVMPTGDPPRFQEGSRIEIPYIIVGLIFLIVGFVLLALHIIGPPEELRERLSTTSGERQALREVCHPKACANNSISCAVFFLIFFILFYVWNTAREIGLNIYLFTYATESDLKFSKDSAASLTGVYSASYMFGRLASMVLARWLPVQVLFCAEVIMTCGTQAALAIAGASNQTLFAVFSCATGFFGSPIWPGEMSWTDQYITMTSTSIFLVTLGASIGSFSFNPLYGAALQNGQYDTFMYLMLVPSLLILANTIVAQVGGVKQGSRFKAEEVQVMSYSKGDEAVEVSSMVSDSQSNIQ